MGGTEAFVDPAIVSPFPLYFHFLLRTMHYYHGVIV